MPRRLRYEVGGRLGADGAELSPVDLSTLPTMAPGLEAVALCLLHADLASSHEEAVAAELAGRGHDVSRSSIVSPEFREYARTLTTVINAYLRPPCRQYLAALASLADEVLVMTSAGGLMPVADGAELPASLLLSAVGAGNVEVSQRVADACLGALAQALPDRVGAASQGTMNNVLVGGDGCITRRWAAGRAGARAEPE